jgi:hypothetical protein
MRKLATAAVAICVTFAGTLATASAHKVTYKTKTAMEYVPPDAELPTHDFLGVIRSKQRACEAKRTIVLLRNRKVVDRTRSLRVPAIDGGRDAWYLFTTGEAAPPRGSYYAGAPPKFLKRTRRHKHRCGLALSNEVRIAGRAASAGTPHVLGASRFELARRAR